MGKELVSVEDIGTEHHGYAPSSVIAGSASATIFVNGKLVELTGHSVNRGGVVIGSGSGGGT